MQAVEDLSIEPCEIIFFSDLSE